MEETCCCTGKTKMRSPEEYKSLANRLHIRSCVVDDVRAGKDEVVDELLATLQKLMK